MTIHVLRSYRASESTKGYWFVEYKVGDELHTLIANLTQEDAETVAAIANQRDTANAALLGMIEDLENNGEILGGDEKRIGFMRAAVTQD